MTQLEEGEYSMKDILKGAKFGDKFVCRNGDIAIYLLTNNKKGYSLQLEKEKKPHHYDVDGHWYAQVDKENPYDVVSKVDDKSVLEGVLKDLQKAEKDLSDEIHFCQEHKMDMEVAALRYKYKAFEQLCYIIYKHERD